MSKFVKINDFLEKYDLEIYTINVKKKQGVLPDYIFRESSNNKMLIDENYFTKRNKFKVKTINNCHDIFFFITKHFNNRDLARGLHAIDNEISVDSWQFFLQVSLFSFQSDSIFNCKLSGMMWKFYRYSRWIIRGAFVLANVKPEHRDVSVLLDRY